MTHVKRLLIGLSISALVVVVPAGTAFAGIQGTG
jgi:hypothetical protein